MLKKSKSHTFWKWFDYKRIDKSTYKFIATTYPIRSIIALLTRIIVLLRNKKVILVFGMSRSGTTMLGNFLALNNSSIYIHEPVVELMKYRYKHTSGKSFWKYIFSEQQREFKIHGLVCVTLLAVLNSPREIETICVKPICMIDVLNETYNTLKNVKLLYICRHPAGRTESIVRQIKHDQNIENVSLKELEREGETWGRINSNVQKLFHGHSDWRWVFFEKLANDPVAEFKQLYEQLGLVWNDSVLNEILQKTTGEDGGFYDIQRDSRKQSDKWRKSMTSEQIEAVRKGTIPFKTNLYESF